MALVDDAKKKVAEAVVTDIGRPYKTLVHRIIAAVLVVLGGKYGATAVVLAVTSAQPQEPCRSVHRQPRQRLARPRCSAGSHR
jgi:hypothetical protein